ncbi:hypothetical protein L1987_86135 [Smallanthus sonchifolius]|uniref:Uncharacterized protein n=1 Tax=Smallanthus sonchifolius TaxID=185202 RepID=A0ACB8XZP6_9ASTR|nr:hypothetical protein L1987_86135 [Smallanthus sonchifolius]
MVHLMFQHEIKSKLNPRTEGLFYVVGGEPLRFGPREFCLINGLRFGKWDGEVPSLESTFKDRVFGGRRMKIEHLEHLYNEDLSHIMDDDMVRLSLLVVVEVGMKSTQKKLIHGRLFGMFGR